MNENSLHIVNHIKIESEGHKFSCLKGLYVEPKDYLPKYTQIELLYVYMYGNQNTDIEKLLTYKSIGCSVQ